MRGAPNQCGKGPNDSGSSRGRHNGCFPQAPNCILQGGVGHYQFEVEMDRNVNCGQRPFEVEVHSPQQRHVGQRRTGLQTVQACKLDEEEEFPNSQTPPPPQKIEIEVQIVPARSAQLDNEPNDNHMAPESHAPSHAGWSDVPKERRVNVENLNEKSKFEGLDSLKRLELERSLLAKMDSGKEHVPTRTELERLQQAKLINFNKRRLAMDPGTVGTRLRPHMRLLEENVTQTDAENLFTPPNIRYPSTNPFHPAMVGPGPSGMNPFASAHPYGPPNQFGGGMHYYNPYPLPMGYNMGQGSGLWGNPYPNPSLHNDDQRRIPLRTTTTQYPVSRRCSLLFDPCKRQVTTHGNEVIAEEHHSRHWTPAPTKRKSKTKEDQKLVLYPVFSGKLEINQELYFDPDRNVVLDMHDNIVLDTRQPREVKKRCPPSPCSCPPSPLCCCDESPDENYEEEYLEVNPNLCPYCGIGIFTRKTSITGYLMAVLCFPWALYCCLRKKCCYIVECTHCHAISPNDPVPIPKRKEEKKKKKKHKKKGKSHCTCRPVSRHCRYSC